MEVRAKGGKGPLLFEWDPETQTVDLIRKDMYYKASTSAPAANCNLRTASISASV